MQGQGDAIGQVIGGPALGGIGSAFGVRAALVFSPVVWLYGRIGGEGAGREEPEAAPSNT